MEQRYEEMNKRNVYWKTRVQVNPTLAKGRCVAAYALGDWYLNSSFDRLLTRLKCFLGDTVCFYKPVPYQSEGLLHQTLLQFVKFDSYPHAEELLLKAMETVSDILARSQIAPWITYKGLVWTPTGIALAGYCLEDDRILKIRKTIEEVLKAQNLPCEIPYFNDILHATLFRWVKQPDSMMLLQLEKEVERWSECTFGEMRVRQWTVGKASWRMREEEREDYFAIPVHQHICHRGNVAGPVKELENNFGVLIQREIQGSWVEVDVWYHDHG